MIQCAALVIVLLVAASAYGQAPSGIDNLDTAGVDNLGRSGVENLGRSSADYPQATVVTDPDDTETPAPGWCRILLLDRPATQQPPPAPCEELKGNVPAGGLLIRGHR
jgi:hypothetical protein